MLFLSCAAVVPSSALAAKSVVLAWDSSPDATVVGYRIHYGTSSSNYTSVLAVGEVTTAVIPGLTEGATYYFSASAYDEFGGQSPLSNEAAYEVPLAEVTNAIPQISAIGNVSMYWNTSSIVIPFTVGDADTPAESLTLAAASSDPLVVPVSNIVFGGSGSNRTVQVTGGFNQIGTATVTVIAIDEALNAVSTTFTVTISLPPPPPGTLNVTLNGYGYVTPALQGQTFLVGQAYTITAVPINGYTFGGWSGGVSSSNPQITFIMTPTMNLQATFIPPPVVPNAGTYHGLFYEPERVDVASAGSFTVTITSGSSYSGKLQLGRSKLSFSGVLNSRGRATNVISRRDAGPLTLSLEIETGADGISGELTDGNWRSTLAGDRAVFHYLNNPAPQAKTYTMCLPGLEGSPSIPNGCGYGTVKVDGNGTLTFAGVLADGTKVTHSAKVSKDGFWPFYVPVYKGQGLLMSWQIFTPTATTDLEGLVSWIKRPNSRAKYYPGGFTHETGGMGSAFTYTGASNLLSVVLANLIFKDGNLNTDFTNRVSIVNNIVSNLSSNSLSMKFKASMGTFSGKVTDPVTGQKFPFKGTVLQKPNLGHGFTLGVNKSGEVILQP